MPVKQNVRVNITVTFDDSVLQADAEEAILDALGNLRRMLALLPAVKGKSSRKKEVSFKIVDVQPGDGVVL